MSTKIRKVIIWILLIYIGGSILSILPEPIIKNQYEIVNKWGGGVQLNAETKDSGTVDKILQNNEVIEILFRKTWQNPSKLQYFKISKDWKIILDSTKDNFNWIFSGTWVIQSLSWVSVKYLWVTTEQNRLYFPFYFNQPIHNIKYLFEIH